MSSVVCRAQRITAVFNDIEVVLFRDRGDRVEIERISERVREHNRPRFRSNSRGQAIDIDIGCREINVDEYRNALILNDWRDRGGKSGGDSNNLAAGLNP